VATDTVRLEPVLISKKHCLKDKLQRINLNTGMMFLIKYKKLLTLITTRDRPIYRPGR